MIPDAQLLQQYAEHNTQDAFAELVGRYINLVYASAMRRVGGDSHTAQEIVQFVFNDLARKARSVARHPTLAGWLHTATRNAAINAARTQRRRRHHEQQAASMNLTSTSPSHEAGWSQLRPILDDVIDRLAENDRDAVVLRFLDGRPFAEIGMTLQISEDAARMRVERALEKLRRLLQQRGVTSTAAALSSVLVSHTALTAPAGMAATIATGAAAHAISVGAVGAGTLWSTLTATKASIALTAAIVLVAASVATVRSFDRSESKASSELASQSAPASVSHSTATLQGGAQLHRGSLANGLEIPDQIPQPKYQLVPRYPSGMQQIGVTGEVLVDFIVDTNGNVTNAYAAKSSHREFEANAVRAVSEWKFTPGRKRGQVVSTHMQVPVIFPPSSKSISTTHPAIKTATSPAETENFHRTSEGSRQRAVMRQNYAPLFEEFGLAPAQQEKLLSLLVDEFEIAADVAAVAGASGVNVTDNPAKFDLSVKKLRQGIQNEIKALLGNDGFIRYLEVRQDRLIQTWTFGLENKLAGTTASLGAEQSRQFQSLLKEKNLHPKDKSVLVEARRFLSLDQLLALDALQRERTAGVRSKKVQEAIRESGVESPRR